MTRYVIRASKPLYIETPLWPDAQPHCPSLTVDGGKEVDTDLIDENGNSIYRLQAPIGFGRDDR